MSDLTTKERIIEHAHKLFAQKGYNGVSIREISQKASVNIAAINYHFSNKENLYIETIKKCRENLVIDINEIYKKTKNINPKDFFISVFHHLVENAEDLKTSFKIYISDSEFYPEELEDRDDYIGPPGGSLFYECIKSYYPQADEEDIIWAVRTIFTQVFIKAILVTTKNITKRKNVYKLSIKDFEDEILRLIDVVLVDIN